MAAVLLAASSSPNATEAIDPALVTLEWGVKIPLRDGVNLNATVYLPAGQKAPTPCVLTLTPYVAQSYHERAMYVAAHGLPFLTVDVRGRGNSEGVFRPNIQEAQDGYDAVEWLAKQPYCNGKIGMWGGSYAGYDQWATAKERPPHLATIVPVASPYVGVDFPMVSNIFSPYAVQWLNLVAGRASQANIFADSRFWTAAYRRWFESGRPFREFDRMVGMPSSTFQEWISHPELDAYWDAYNPTSADYAALTIPILTITGMYDGDQAGALAHYRNYMAAASPAGRARHFLVIGPWDHAGTRVPTESVAGIKFGPNALVDIARLHSDWYAWTMEDGTRPVFLKRSVAYYVTGADQWRYADTLDAVTGETRPFYLQSTGGAADDVLASGSMVAGASASGAPDRYVNDPRDTSIALAQEASQDPGSILDQTNAYSLRGHALFYHTAPFEKDTEVSGFFRFAAWIAIDQPDTDFQVTISDILPDGSSIPLTTALMRARYRESLRAQHLITLRAPQLYEFRTFTFASRMVSKGSRLRLVFAPVLSINLEKNYNSGGVVADESIKDARTVTVQLFHDKAHPTVLYVPIAAQSSSLQ